MQATDLTAVGIFQATWTSKGSLTSIPLAVYRVYCIPYAGYIKFVVYGFTVKNLQDFSEFKFYCIFGLALTRAGRPTGLKFKIKVRFLRSPGTTTGAPTPPAPQYCQTDHIMKSHWIQMQKCFLINILRKSSTNTSSSTERQLVEYAKKFPKSRLRKFYFWSSRFSSLKHHSWSSETHCNARDNVIMPNLEKSELYSIAAWKWKKKR